MGLCLQLSARLPRSPLGTWQVFLFKIWVVGYLLDRLQGCQAPLIGRGWRTLLLRNYQSLTQLSWSKLVHFQFLWNSFQTFRWMSSDASAESDGNSLTGKITGMQYREKEREVRKMNEIWYGFSFSSLSSIALEKGDNSVIHMKERLVGIKKNVH